MVNPFKVADTAVLGRSVVEFQKGFDADGHRVARRHSCPLEQRPTVKLFDFP